jgi:secondary thiamine-phosphate synthase enzyme
VGTVPNYGEEAIRMRRLGTVPDRVKGVFMASHTSYIQIQSKGFSDVIDITAETIRNLKNSRVKNGILCIFVPGSTASVTTIEYESGVVEDLKSAIERLASSDIAYKHDRRWGDGNGFSHVRAAIMKPGITIPIVDGELTLGTWQQIVFIDFDNKPRGRRIVVQIVGE